MVFRMSFLKQDF